MDKFESTEELLQHYEAVHHRICVEAPIKYIQRGGERVKYVPVSRFRHKGFFEESTEPIIDRCELGLLYFTKKNVIKRIIARHERENGLEPGTIVGGVRCNKIVKVRHAAICEAYGIYRRKVSLPKLGKAFELDHTTILYILRKYHLFPWGKTQKFNRNREFSTGATKSAISPSKNVHPEVAHRPHV